MKPFFLGLLSAVVAGFVIGCEIKGVDLCGVLPAQVEGIGVQGRKHCF